MSWPNDGPLSKLGWGRRDEDKPTHGMEILNGIDGQPVYRVTFHVDAPVRQYSKEFLKKIFPTEKHDQQARHDEEPYTLKLKLDLPAEDDE
jgi:hypothetical protein